MARKSVARLLICLLLLTWLPSLAVAQAMSATGSGSWGQAIISNFPDCSTGGVNCWHASKLQASSVFSVNGQTYAIDSSGNGYSYADYPTNAWTAHPEWGQVYALQHAGDGNLYGLVGSCSGAHYIAKWTGSTWQTLAGCFATFSAAADGSSQFVAADSNGTIWLSTNYGASFSQLPWCNATSVVSVNSGGLTVACGGNVWNYGNSTWNQVAGIANASQIGEDVNGTLYALGTDGCVYHYSGSAWDKLSGCNKTWLANGGSLKV